MPKKKKKPQHRKLTPTGVAITDDAIRLVAMRHSVSVEEVRKQIQIAMLNGLVNGQMDAVPREGDVPTPEEVVAYGAEEVFLKRDEPT